MRNGRQTSASDHESDLYEVRERTPVNEVVYFLVDPEYTKVKIGWSKDFQSRLSTHWTTDPDMQIHALIVGTFDNDREIQKHFSTYRRARESYRIEGDVAAYLDFLADRAWAAASIEEIEHIYPYPNRFPWNADIKPWGQHGLFQSHPEVRRPQRRDTRVLRTIRSESDEWHTPSLYIEAARRAMGAIDLDPASSALAQQTVNATSVITKEEDGLRHYWRGRVWLNPPYGRGGKGGTEDFVNHALSEYRVGRTTQAILCLNAHAIDTLWFQPLWQFPICFTHHRPRFEGGARGSNVGKNSTGGTAFVYLGHDTAAFSREFSRFGPIVGCTTPASTDSKQFRRDCLDRSWDANFAKREESIV